MSLREDFAADHPLQAVLTDMGVELVGKGDRRKAKCPFHEDKNPSFSVDLKDGSWNCFAGCGGGGVIELVARREGKTVEHVLEQYGKEKAGGEQKKNTPPVDWPAAVEAFGEAHQKRLCEWRGLSSGFVGHLVRQRMVGICDGNLAFPIFAAGRVIGTHQRLANGGWLIRGGVGSPWVIGDHFENVLIFESQWDAFILMDALRWFDNPQLAATCAIVITRGAAKGKAVQNLFPLGGRIICWMQNDQPDAKGNVASDKWLSDLVHVLQRTHVCRPPKSFKDLNDWWRSGEVNAVRLIEMMEQAELYRDPNLPALPTPLDFRRMIRFNPQADPDCLLGNRYLCRGGSAIWVGGSGLGKSVMTLQAAIQFALGESLLGLEPKKPLRSIILSAEDDEGDLSETLQGVLKGMDIEAGSERFQRVVENVLLFQENTLKGLPLIGLAQQLVIERQADLLWLNPLLSYYSGNPSDAEKSSEFTGALSQMQAATKVCTMLVHHTGKPKDSETTKSWSIDDFSYIGLGSSVWTNWARAILVLQSMKQPKNTFVLRFAKRGQRSGIVNDQFEKVREIYIQHAEHGLCWIPSDFTPGDNEDSTGGRPTKASWAKVFDAWDGSGKTSPELKALFRQILGVSDKTASRMISKWSGVHIIKNTSDLWIKS